MKKIDTHKILIQLSTIDNRIVDEYTVEMWHRVIGDYEYEDAELAIPVAFAESDAYMTPHRLLTAIKKIKDERAVSNNHQQLQLESSEWKSDPEPTCAEHNKGITQCQPCYMRLYREAPNVYGQQLHDWAVQNIYTL
jgi:hypothetical protein